MEEFIAPNQIPRFLGGQVTTFLAHSAQHLQPRIPTEIDSQLHNRLDVVHLH